MTAENNRSIPMIWRDKSYVISLTPSGHVIVYHDMQPVGNGHWVLSEQAVTDGRGDERHLGEQGWLAVDLAIARTLQEDKPIGEESCIIIKDEDLPEITGN